MKRTRKQSEALDEEESDHTKEAQLWNETRERIRGSGSAADIEMYTVLSEYFEICKKVIDDKLVELKTKLTDIENSAANAAATAARKRLNWLFVLWGSAAGGVLIVVSAYILFQMIDIRIRERIGGPLSEQVETTLFEPFRNLVQPDIESNNTLWIEVLRNIDEGVSAQQTLMHLAAMGDALAGYTDGSSDQVVVDALSSLLTEISDDDPLSIAALTSVVTTVTELFLERHRYARVLGIYGTYREKLLPNPGGLHNHQQLAENVDLAACAYIVIHGSSKGHADAVTALQNYAFNNYGRAFSAQTLLSLLDRFPARMATEVDADLREMEWDRDEFAAQIRSKFQVAGSELPVLLERLVSIMETDSRVLAGGLPVAQQRYQAVRDALAALNATRRSDAQ